MLAAGLIALGCGSDDDRATTSTAATGEDLTAVKDYLTDHAADLDAAGRRRCANAEEYYALAEAADFDYDALMEEHGEEVERAPRRIQDAFVEANPAYEEMEGIVAGVPRLAQYDVDIDAGSDASDPENAVSFSLELPDGETMKQPGNLFFLTETALYGTNPDLLAEASSRTSTATARSSSARACPTPTSTSRRCASSRAGRDLRGRRRRRSSRRRRTRSPRSRS